MSDKKAIPFLEAWLLEEREIVLQIGKIEGKLELIDKQIKEIRES